MATDLQALCAKIQPDPPRRTITLLQQCETLLQAAGHDNSITLPGITVLRSADGSYQLTYTAELPHHKFLTGTICISVDGLQSSPEKGYFVYLALDLLQRYTSILSAGQALPNVTGTADLREPLVGNNGYSSAANIARECLLNFNQIGDYGGIHSRLIGLAETDEDFYYILQRECGKVFWGSAVGEFIPLEPTLLTAQQTAQWAETCPAVESFQFQLNNTHL